MTYPRLSQYEKKKKKRNWDSQQILFHTTSVCLGQIILAMPGEPAPEKTGLVEFSQKSNFCLETTKNKI